MKKEDLEPATANLKPAHQADQPGAANRRQIILDLARIAAVPMVVTSFVASDSTDVLAEPLDPAP